MNKLKRVITRKAKHKDILDTFDSTGDQKNVYLSCVFHEIRTPVNAIVGMTELARNSIHMDDGVKEYLDNIYNSSEYLLMLLNDFLDMSKIRQNKMTVGNETFIIKDIVDEVGCIVRTGMEAKQIRYSVICDRNVDAVYMGDALKIKQVLINLLYNAQKYTNIGGRVTLTIRCRNTEMIKGTKRIVFAVSDTGVGIAQDEMERIFEPFNRGSCDSMIPGTGLGLALCRLYVEMLGGNIGVDSKVGLGTTFSMELPLDVVSDEECVKEELVCEHIHEDVGIEITSHMNILLVDDNALNLSVTKSMLELMGYRVDTASDGEMAVQMFKEKSEFFYSFILMDVTMPVMNGFEATRKIRELDRDDSELVKIIALTANSYSEYIEQCLLAGMNGHVAKPIRMETLRKRLLEYSR